MIDHKRLCLRHPCCPLLLKPITTTGGFVSDRLREPRYLWIQQVAAPPARKCPAGAAELQLQHGCSRYPPGTLTPPVPFIPFRTTQHGAVEILPVQKFCRGDGNCSQKSLQRSAQASDHVQILSECSVNRHESVDTHFSPPNDSLTEIKPATSLSSTLLLCPRPRRPTMCFRTRTLWHHQQQTEPSPLTQVTRRQSR